MFEIWDAIAFFVETNPELHPALWLLAAYLGVYLVLLFASQVAASVRSKTPPFLDQIVHIMLLVSFVAMAVLAIYFAVLLYYNPMYYVQWYNVAVYVVLLAVNVLLVASQVPHLRRERD